MKKILKYPWIYDANFAKFWKIEDITDAPLAWRDTDLKSSQGGLDSLQALSK